jgi:hypothetical protein
MFSFVKEFEKVSIIQVMKKIISISLTFLILIATLHLSVATHYCGGNIAASRISLSGKFASCGMEDNDKDLPVSGSHFASHCCDNVLVYYGINSIYFPSLSFVPESYQHNFQVYNFLSDLTINTLVSIKSIYTSVSPPDGPVSNSVDLSCICVFRI